MGTESPLSMYPCLMAFIKLPAYLCWHESQVTTLLKAFLFFTEALSAKEREVGTSLHEDNRAVLNSLEL